MILCPLYASSCGSRSTVIKALPKIKFMLPGNQMNVVNRLDFKDRVNPDHVHYAEGMPRTQNYLNLPTLTFLTTREPNGLKQVAVLISHLSFTFF